MSRWTVTCCLWLACAESTQPLARPREPIGDAGRTASAADAAPADAAPDAAQPLDAGLVMRPPPALRNTLLGDGEHAVCGGAMAWNGRTVVVLWCQLRSTTLPDPNLPLDADYFWSELEPDGTLIDTRPIAALPGLVTPGGLLPLREGYAALTLGAFDGRAAVTLLGAQGEPARAPIPLPADTQVALARADAALVFTGRFEGGHAFGRLDLATEAVEHAVTSERPAYFAARWRGDRWLLAEADLSGPVRRRTVDALGRELAPAQPVADAGYPFELLDDAVLVSRARSVNPRRSEVALEPGARLLVEDAAFYAVRGRAERVTDSHAVLAWAAGTSGFNGTAGFAWITADAAQPCTVADVVVRPDFHTDTPALAVLDQGDVGVLWQDFRAHPFQAGQPMLPRAAYAYQRVRAGRCP